MHQTIIEMYESPHGGCAAHAEISAINVSSYFQHDCQTGPHGTAFLKELSGTATNGGVRRERGRERESVGLSGLCKAYWSVNDVCALPRLGHSMATD